VVRDQVLKRGRGVGRGRHSGLLLEASCFTDTFDFIGIMKQPHEGHPRT